MLANIAIGCLMGVLTVIVHATGMGLCLTAGRVSQSDRWGGATRWSRMAVIGVLVSIMFAASVIEASLWAVTYIVVGAISGFEHALYFSMVTFTTLGYGDVVLEGQWRLLGAFEAANGIIMFGWTTALIVAVVAHVYFPSKSAEAGHS